MEEKIYRSAITGRFVTEEYAREHPDTTVGERVENREGRKDERAPGEDRQPLVLWYPLEGYRRLKEGEA